MAEFTIIDDVLTTEADREKCKLMNDNACKNLANAIIIRACLDYDIGFNKQGYKNFFRSDWFQILSRGCCSPELLINHLEREGVPNGEKFFTCSQF